MISQTEYFPAVPPNNIFAKTFSQNVYKENKQTCVFIPFPSFGAKKVDNCILQDFFKQISNFGEFWRLMFYLLVIFFVVASFDVYLRRTTFFSFTLYPDYSRISRGNLAQGKIRSPNRTVSSYRDITCWVTEHNAALCLVTRANKWKMDSNSL